MPRKKSNPEEASEMKVSYDIDAFGNVINEMIANEICKMEAMTPVVQTLNEFGITGIRALSFIMRLGQLNSEYLEEKQNRSI